MRKRVLVSYFDKYKSESERKDVERLPHISVTPNLWVDLEPLTLPGACSTHAKQKKF
jgi:hypothetical protein